MLTFFFRKPVLTLLGAGFLFLGAHAADWPNFLGPSHNAISSETGLLQKLPPNGPPLLWHNKIGTGYSAPSVRGETLVLHHRIGGEEIVEAFQASSGKSIWKHAYPSSFIDPYGYNNGPRCTPLLTTNRVYTFGAEGKLVCLDLASGKPVWTRDTDKDWQVPQAFFGVGSTPILENNLLITMVGGQPNSGVVAFDPETGKTVWESVGEKNWEGQPMIGWPGDRKVIWNKLEKQASYASPVAATINGERQVLCLMRQGLVSLNPTNGAVNFSFWFRSKANDSVNASDPLVVSNHIFISAAYYKVGSVLLKVRPDNKGVEEIWRDTSMELHWTTPIFLDNHLYAFSGRNEPDARFRCINYFTGQLKWDRDERWQGHQPLSPTFGRASSILADGKLITLGEAGLLGLFEPNPEKVIEISRWQVPQLHYPCWAGPVLANKKLYLRSEDALVCLDMAAKN